MTALAGATGIRAVPDPEFLARVDDLVARRVEEVVALLGEVGGDPAAYGGHGVDLGEQLRLRTRVPGKRVRPRLAAAGHAAAGGGAGGGSGREELVTLGAALEMLHLFALVHDDVMDRSAHRRGLETAHHLAARRHRASSARGDADRYGDSVAILLGDLLLTEASDLVADLPGRVRPAWRAMVVELVHGQLLDVTATASPHASRPAGSALVARLKTGRYTVRRPVELGALLLTDDPCLLEALATWGDHVGDAFGLRDDVLGVWGDLAVTGKPERQDLCDGTATRLLAWAAEVLAGPDLVLLDRCRDRCLDDAGARRLADAMACAGVPARAEVEIDRLLAAADGALVGTGGPAPVAPTHRTHLGDLAVALSRRTR
ncbi:polyprenyl synthetase family protein [Nocardioidaceae bacterium]|nr:polyprenyl synthetase family protein [Nocardioidaceae bacterium]